MKTDPLCHNFSSQRILFCKSYVVNSACVYSSQKNWSAKMSLVTFTATSLSWYICIYLLIKNVCIFMYITLSLILKYRTMHPSVISSVFSRLLSLACHFLPLFKPQANILNGPLFRNGQIMLKMWQRKGDASWKYSLFHLKRWAVIKATRLSGISSTYG